MKHISYQIIVNISIIIIFATLYLLLSHTNLPYTSQYHLIILILKNYIKLFFYIFKLINDRNSLT